MKKFKRPKNREDSSDFDDFRTKRIVPAQPIFWKQYRKKRTNIFRKNRKNIDKFRKNFHQSCTDHCFYHALTCLYYFDLLISLTSVPFAEFLPVFEEEFNDHLKVNNQKKRNQQKTTKQKKQKILVTKQKQHTRISNQTKQTNIL